jgi:hypothetical protein
LGLTLDKGEDQVLVATRKSKLIEGIFVPGDVLNVVDVEQSC